MRLTEARVLCPGLIVLPGDYRRYEQAARRMHAICLDHTPLVEVAALDDLYLDLSCPSVPVDQAVRNGERIAQTLRRQIGAEVGLSVSVGVGTNKLVAKVATRQAKPGGVVSVPAGDEERYLAPWPVEVLPGAGPKTRERLARLNVRKVSELAAVPPAVLAGLFGRPGLTLHQFARGIDTRPVRPDRPQQSVSRRASFEPPTADLPFVAAMLDHLLERAAGWLRFQNLACRGLAVTIHYGDYAGLTGRVSFRRPVEDERALLKARVIGWRGCISALAAGSWALSCRRRRRPQLSLFAIRRRRRPDG
jgi:DNA polymerase-4